MWGADLTVPLLTFELPKGIAVMQKKQDIKSTAVVGSFRKQRGYTIVELSVAVAIAGVLMVGSISLVQTVLNTSRANDTITGLARTIAQIDKIWSASNSYADLSMATAGAAGAFEGMTVGRDPVKNTVNSVTNKFNRPVTLSLNDNLPATSVKRGYTLVYAGIPTSVCADIVTSAVNSGVRALVVMPESTSGTAPDSLSTLTLSSAGALDSLPASGATVMFQPSAPDLNIVTMTGSNACGTTKNTVSLGFVTWK